MKEYDNTIKLNVFYSDLAREFGFKTFQDMMNNKKSISTELKKAIDIICKLSGRAPLFKMQVDLTSGIFV